MEEKLEYQEIDHLVLARGLTVFYKGETLNGKPHGQGKASYTNGGWYDGGWKNGKRDGRGEEYYVDDVLHYEGEWKEDNRHGMGKSYYTDGKLAYEGEWKNDKPINFPSLSNWA